MQLGQMLDALLVGIAQHDVVVFGLNGFDKPYRCVDLEFSDF